MTKKNRPGKASEGRPSIFAYPFAFGIFLFGSALGRVLDYLDPPPIKDRYY